MRRSATSIRTYDARDLPAAKPDKWWFPLPGDWLLIYGELEEPDDSPDVRYNRRTHELRYAERFW